VPSESTPTGRNRVMDAGARVSLLTPSDPRWVDALRQVDHDIYHLPEYVAFAARQEAGYPIAAFAEAAGVWLLIPVILRPVPPLGSGDTGSLFDAASPYGYSSPLTNAGVGRGSEELAALRRLVQACVAALDERGAVTLFVRLHPLLRIPIEPLTEWGTVVHHGDTVFVDLSRSEEELWNEMRSDHRRDVQTARRRGAVAFIDKRWDRFADFVAVYQQTMHRVQADAYYHFSDQYFLDLRSALGDRLHLSIVEIDGRVACAGLVTESGGIVQTHLAGTSDEFLRWSPNKLRIDFLRSWAKARGNRFLHLGGGVGGQVDALFNFKAAFSPMRSAYHTWRVVVDEAVYRHILAHWESEGGASGEGVDDYFPPYRKPSADFPATTVPSGLAP
jgi:hypothetical protein